MSPAPAELAALAEIAQGATLQQTARRLGVSDRTVRRRLRGACDSVGVATPVEAIVWAAKHQLI